MHFRAPKVATVHDYLNQKGGDERVVAVLYEVFPEAPIFPYILDYDNLWSGLPAAIRPSWMQRLPGEKKHFKKYLFFLPKSDRVF